VVAEVRRRLHTKRVGHTGTLDPMATGLLPVCVGEATKLVPFLTDCDKGYEADVVFGVATTTGDAEGEVKARVDARNLDPRRVAAEATRLTGALEQLPPMHSAVKVNGRRLYELARQGEEIERKARPIVVHELTVSPLRIVDESAVYRLSIRCSKGTYVRVIAEDLGSALGVGAHLSALRRTALGRFSVTDAIPLDAVTAESRLLGLAEAVEHLPARSLDAVGAKRVRDGQERWLLETADPPPLGRSRLLNLQGELVAVIQRTGQKIVFERVFVDRPGVAEANNHHLEIG
jgi:tRNA pseudouridine55 synthase